MKRPIFSVIIPTYNRTHLLPRAIASVVTQTFKDFELIIVDDASTQDVQAVINRFPDRRISYIRRKKNGGNAATRNLGIANAKGEFISFLDDDDEYLPEFLEKTYIRLVSTTDEVGFAWCGYLLVKLSIDNQENVIGQELWQPKFQDRTDAYLSFLKSRKIGTGCGLTIRRSCFDKVGPFDEKLRKAVDTDFLIRLVRYFDFVVIPEFLIKIHQHSNLRVSKNSRAGADAYERIIKKHFTILREHPTLLAQLYYKVGWLHYHAHNKTAARNFLLRALKIHPLQFKGWLALILLESSGSRGPSIHQLISAWKHRILK